MISTLSNGSQGSDSSNCAEGALCLTWPLGSMALQVVDSTDRARIGIAKSELFGLLENEDLAKVPILVLANKQVS